MHSVSSAFYQSCHAPAHGVQRVARCPVHFPLSPAPNQPLPPKTNCPIMRALVISCVPQRDLTCTPHVHGMCGLKPLCMAILKKLVHTRDKHLCMAILEQLVHARAEACGGTGHPRRDQSAAREIAVVPRQLARPWAAVCKELGMPCILTSAGVDTWNWAAIDGSVKQHLGRLPVCVAVFGYLSLSPLHTRTHAPMPHDVSQQSPTCYLVAVSV